MAPALFDDRDIALIEGVGRHAHPLAGGAADYDPLLERVGDAPYVLLGEASHGTDDF